MNTALSALDFTAAYRAVIQQTACTMELSQRHLAMQLQKKHLTLQKWNDIDFHSFQDQFSRLSV